MRVFLLNLPYSKPIMRRYVASYFAPNFLLPPLELMSLGAVAKRLGCEVRLLDAIAEGAGEALVTRTLVEYRPDLLVVQSGFNVFPADMATLARIQSQLDPAVKTCLFGYLATQFPQEIMDGSAVDYILLDEPEEPFASLLAQLSGTARAETTRGLPMAGAASEGWAGIWRRDAGAPPVATTRLRDLDELPFADYSLVDLDHYSEAFLDSPFGVVLATRGCPYKCSFCVTTYGRRLVERSPENIVDELRHMRDEFGISNVRFLDDTITINRKRMKRICELMLEENLDVKWTAFTRVDQVDAATLRVMKQAGCQRLYAGIESGSQRILDLYDKGLDKADIRDGVRLIRQAGLEMSAFFIVGAPGETEADVDESIDLAIELDLDYIIVTKLQYWPGTPLFDKNPIEFELFADRETLYRNDHLERAHQLQKRFYRRFYLRPSYIRKRLGTFVQAPRDVAVGFAKLCHYLFVARGHDDLI